MSLVVPPQGGAPTLISLRNVTKDFGAFRAVADLSLDIRKGQITTLLGRTGAGKTTVLNMIMGTIAPTSGTVEVAGVDPHRQFRTLRGKLAVSFQTDRLLPWRTAIENAELGLLILGVSRSKARDVARSWLARVNLAGAEDKYIHELSGGMRQRVSLARALAVDPEIVLLDESFSQLDHVTSRALRRDFCEVARKFHKTCLMITHRIEDALEMADRVIVLGPGAHIALDLSLSGADRANGAHRRDIEKALGHEETDT
jgi:NitT/TauT family transport system ATP-binding protein